LLRLDLNESHILEAIRRDDRNEFEKMFRTWYKPLCAFAFGFLQSKDEAEECVQSTFIQLWEKRKELNIEISLKSYLYRAVRNGCFNILKHEKVKREHATYALQHGVISGGQPSQEMMTAELESRISSALIKLPEQCRLIFQMSRFEELKYAEIAKELGISIKTVENQMGKALKIMREELKQYLPALLIIMQGFNF